jgi:anti-sigma factor RsiW
MWRVLFEDLDALGSHRPGPHFHARVMSGVLIPEELPVAARLRGWLAALTPGAPLRHVAAGILQDLADGALTAREAARTRRHIDGCATCADELRSWSTVVSRLSELDRFTPDEAFTERVIAGLRHAPARVARRAGWSHALAGARRLLPRTRRAWAALAGASVTPAVTIGLVLYAVFSHPTLTPQALASFAFWQFGDLFITGWSALLAGGLSLARLTGMGDLVDTMVQAPLMAAGAFAIYAVAFVIAVRVLYNNLVARRPMGFRYASASTS